MVNDGMDGFTGLMEFITGILDLGDEVINRSLRGAAGLTGTRHMGSTFSRFRPEQYRSEKGERKGGQIERADTQVRYLANGGCGGTFP